MKGWGPAGTTAQWSAVLFSWHNNTSGQSVDELAIFGNYPATGRNEINFYFEGANAGNAYSNAEFQDPSAWYHVVWQSSSTSAVKLYVNNVEITDWRTSGSVTAQNFINKNQTCSIGARAPGNTSPSGAQYHGEGYLAAAYFIDGTAKSPSDFGKTNEDGVWVPQNYTGSYGTNGFHLTFDSSQTNGIGHDSSGNGNHFTATGFDTAAISSSNEDNDVDYNDTPTNNYATLNPLLGRSASLNFEQANLRLQYGAGGALDGMVGFGIPGSSGKYYWEVTLKDQKEGAIGIVSSDYDLENGTLDFSDEAGGWSWRVTEGTRENGGTEVNNSHTVPNVGDTIGFLLDTDAGTCTIEINGVAQTANNGAEYTNIPTDKTIYPYIRQGGGSGDVNTDWNFGQMAFQHEPTGYQHVATNSLPEPTIKKGNQHFGVLTYAAPASPSYPITINGSGGNNGTGELDFDQSPDLVWIKMRNGAQNHIIFDTVRGASNSLRPDDNISEVTTRSNFAFATNGFTFSAADAETYQQNDSYVAWCWKAGGTAVTNTDGTNSNTVNVSANQDAGFSIVTYTGEASNSPNTIGHGLNAVPEFIIVKRRDATENWAVYHASLGNDRSLELHDTTAQSASTSAFWNSTTPTSSVFSVGNGGATNQAGGTYVAYCWHSVEGFSKIGTYSGNGSSDGAYIHCGFKPAMVILKRIDAASNWHIRDAERNPNNPDTDWMEIDNAAAEQTGNAGYNIDYYANGFKWRGTVLNVSGGNYVYIAFAENPFGGENAAPATAR
jgi:hypothetical protein